MSALVLGLVVAVAGIVYGLRQVRREVEKSRRVETELQQMIRDYRS